MMMIEDDIVKRIVYSKIGGPESIEIIDEELGKPNNNQVKVRVYRAGINFADLMMRQGLYGSNPDFPFTPGYEASGIIIETGNEVKELEVGERVIAMTGFGGYAEEVIVDSSNIIQIPYEICKDHCTQKWFESGRCLVFHSCFCPNGFEAEPEFIEAHKKFWEDKSEEE